MSAAVGSGQSPGTDSLLAALQPAATDTPVYANPFEVVVTAPRLDLPLKQNPAATTVVPHSELRTMPRTIGVDEALRLVPGVRIDNQADGERVHMSIRGQGILTERGIRGIKILLDGLPLNDPSGFAPDLYDVDWATVRRIEVLRGPAAALYGGGSSAGVINITTEDGGRSGDNFRALSSFGSYGFWKSLAQVGGSRPDASYRLSASRMRADGYRVHTAYWANNIYGKYHWEPTANVELTEVLGWTEFFNQNAEGLNAEQLNQDPRQANPDAVPKNEYQLTRRLTTGVSGQVRLTEKQDLSFNGYYRTTFWKEPVPSSVQHRTFQTPGASVQYNLRHGEGFAKNTVSIGTDLGWQSIDETRFKNVGEAREDTLLSKQDIFQRGAGVFVLDRVELGAQWGVMASARYDYVHNELTDLKADTIRTDTIKAYPIDLSGRANFERFTCRVGAAFTWRPELNLYANWAQGFLPPATEELANNPVQMGGFNVGLKSATSQGEEIGARGVVVKGLSYDLAAFHLMTDHDFDRYRMSDRPLETFYRNAGSSRRLGVESLVKWSLLHSLDLSAACTYSDFTYTKPDFLDGNRLPNCPRYQSYWDAEYRIPVLPGLRVGASMEAQSGWKVNIENTVAVRGFTLYHARVSYRLKVAGFDCDLMVYGRNLLGAPYLAFTEPDPDGNSFQPGPRQEVFGSVDVRF